MKVLIIGNANSIWVKNVIEKTYLPFGDKVSVLSSSNDVFSEYYKEHKVKILEWRKRDSLKNFLHDYRCLAKCYDIVQVHFVRGDSSSMGRINRLFSKRLILSFWGSDLFRAENADTRIKRALNAASAITMSTPEMEEKFHHLYGDRYDSKIHRLGFGVKGLDVLQAMKAERSDLLHKYFIPENKVIISIGYNKSQAQQHVKVLDVIHSFSKDIQAKIHIVLRLTYGSCEPGYVEKIKCYLSKLDCTYSLFENYLSDEEFAELTILTDVFIHAQTSDAQSASVSEHLYAGCLVLNPSWIKYSNLKDKVFYLSFNDFNDLGSLLSENIVSKAESPYKDLLKENSKRIYELCSWKTAVQKWRSVYSGK
ncbi:MAG: hypothetical protein K6E60_04365 [Saccharofermentans sp.]|nr:hypothetical protein [Saccharofermentans sp.]